jgi:hypothetical protein
MGERRPRAPKLGSPPLLWRVLSVDKRLGVGNEHRQLARTQDAGDAAEARNLLYAPDLSDLHLVDRYPLRMPTTGFVEFAAERKGLRLATRCPSTGGLWSGSGRCFQHRLGPLRDYYRVPLSDEERHLPIIIKFTTRARKPLDFLRGMVDKPLRDALRPAAERFAGRFALGGTRMSDAGSIGAAGMVNALIVRVLPGVKCMPGGRARGFPSDTPKTGRFVSLRAPTQCSKDLIAPTDLPEAKCPCRAVSFRRRWSLRAISPRVALGSRYAPARLRGREST